jgi:hypothetical protein
MAWTDTTIENGLVRLLAFTKSDKPFIREMYSDPDVRRYLGGPLDPAAVDQVVAGEVGVTPGVFCVVDISMAVAVGSVELDHHHGSPRCPTSSCLAVGAKDSRPLPLRSCLRGHGPITSMSR